jgi:DNA-directed RNA polymerase subunit RPC12/RpoP
VLAFPRARLRARASIAQPMAAPTAETYTTDEEALRTFFEEFEQDDEHDEPVRKYKERLQAIADRTTKVFELELDDVADSPHGGEELCDRIVQNARRYVEIISSAIDAKLPVAIELAGDDDNLDVMNAMRAERMREQQRNRAADGDEAGEGGAGDDMEVLKLLRRRYQVVLLPRALDKSVPLRHVMSAHIGRLVTIKGIVTRVTAVKPQLQVATYTCDQCGNEIYQEISGRAYMPPTACPSPMCIHNRTNGRLRIQTRGCKFIPYQVGAHARRGGATQRARQCGETGAGARHGACQACSSRKAYRRRASDPLRVRARAPPSRALTRPARAHATRARPRRCAGSARAGGGGPGAGRPRAARAHRPRLRRDHARLLRRRHRGRFRNLPARAV